MSLQTQGTEITPTSIDVKPTGASSFVMGADITNLPKDAPIEAIRRNIAVKKGQIIQTLTQFINPDGTTREVLSRVSVVTEDGIQNAGQTWGKLDSPISYRFFDVS